MGGYLEVDTVVSKWVVKRPLMTTKQVLDALGLADIRLAKSPIHASIEGWSPLDHSLRSKFMIMI